jgi:hypothetical protein
VFFFYFVSNDADVGGERMGISSGTCVATNGTTVIFDIYDSDKAPT